MIPLKNVFLVIFLAVANLSLAQSKDEELLNWSASRKLTWKDFTASPDRTSSNAALTSSSINVEFGYNKSGLTYTIKCRFNKNLSWGRIKNDYILAHEQGHFDISELYARMLYKSLKEYSFNSRTVNKDINDLYNAMMKEHRDMQQLYDLETDHSRDASQQDRWEIKISELLDKYKDFAGYKS